MKFEYLDTKNLRLRKLDVGVYEYVYKNYSKQEIKVFFNHQTDEEFLNDKQRVEKGLTTFNTDVLMFHLIDKISNNTIGTCGYHTWNLVHSRAELGYFMTNEKFKRKGLMTEALSTIVDYGFNEMDLNRIEALIAPNNEPSLRLVQGLNFIQEGHLRSHYFKDGKHEDSVFYSLLKKDYQFV